MRALNKCSCAHVQFLSCFFGLRRQRERSRIHRLRPRRKVWRRRRNRALLRRRLPRASFENRRRIPRRPRLVRRERKLFNNFLVFLVDRQLTAALIDRRVGSRKRQLTAALVDRPVGRGSRRKSPTTFQITFQDRRRQRRPRLRIVGRDPLHIFRRHSRRGRPPR